MIIAMATAASAAAIVIIKIAKNIPLSRPGNKYLLNATKLIFTLFSISSIDISIVIMFLRVNNPYMPIKKRAVLTNRICIKGTLFIVLELLSLLAIYNFF